MITKNRVNLLSVNFADTMEARDLAAGLGIDVETVWSYARSKNGKPKVPKGFPVAHRHGRTLYYLRSEFDAYKAANLRRVERALARRAADTPA